MSTAAVAAVAIHAFTAKAANQLSFAKDDVLSVHDTTAGGWWQATLRGKSGLIPSNYVTVVEHQSGLRAIALFDFEATSENQLSFPRGATLEIVEMTGRWWTARYQGSTGTIPSNFVRILLPSEQPQDTRAALTGATDGGSDSVASPRLLTVVVPREPTRPDQLRLAAGDDIVVVSDVDDNWYMGHVQGRPEPVGLVPRSHVVPKHAALSPMADIAGQAVASGDPAANEPDDGVVHRNDEGPSLASLLAEVDNGEFSAGRSADDSLAALAAMAAGTESGSEGNDDSGAGVPSQLAAMGGTGGSSDSSSGFNGDGGVSQCSAEGGGLATDPLVALAALAKPRPASPQQSLLLSSSSSSSSSSSPSTPPARLPGNGSLAGGERRGGSNAEESLVVVQSPASSPRITGQQRLLPSGRHPLDSIQRNVLADAVADDTNSLAADSRMATNDMAVSLLRALEDGPSIAAPQGTGDGKGADRDATQQVASFGQGLGSPRGSGVALLSTRSGMDEEETAILLADTQVRLVSLREEFSAAQLANAAMEAELMDLRRNYQDLLGENRALAAAVAQHETRHDVLRSQTEAQSGLEADLRAEVDRLRRKQREADRQTQAEAARLAQRMEADRGEALAAVKHAQHLAEVRAAEAEQARREATAWRAKHAEIAVELRAAVETEVAHRREADSLRRRVADLENALAAAEAIAAEDRRREAGALPRLAAQAAARAADEAGSEVRRELEATVDGYRAVSTLAQRQVTVLTRAYVEANHGRAAAESEAIRRLSAARSAGHNDLHALVALRDRLAAVQNELAGDQW